MSKTPRDRSPTPASGNRRSRRAEAAGAKSDKPVIIHGEIPSREVLLEFIADNPDRASKREIAKAFGLKGDARVELKEVLRALESDGLVQKDRKSLKRPGALPPVTVLDITTRDKDGELIGRPAEWNEELGVAPAVAIRQSSADRAKGKAPVGGLG
ncbi:MAG: ribonuclease R, partial [Rhizobium sp.]|nr:ribonuclease R [Rhizobium sp.]